MFSCDFVVYACHCQELFTGIKLKGITRVLQPAGTRPSERVYAEASCHELRDGGDNRRRPRRWCCVLGRMLRPVPEGVRDGRSAGCRPFDSHAHLASCVSPPLLLPCYRTRAFHHDSGNHHFDRISGGVSVSVRRDSSPGCALGVDSHVCRLGCSTDNLLNRIQKDCLTISYQESPWLCHNVQPIQGRTASPSQNQLREPISKKAAATVAAFQSLMRVCSYTSTSQSGSMSANSLTTCFRLASNVSSVESSVSL